MTVTIKREFLSGGSGLTPLGHGTPSVTDALRQVADDLGAVNTRQKSLQAKLDTFIAAYNAHRGVAGVHTAADVDNQIAAPVATDVIADILTLLNDAVAKFELHRVNISGGIHGLADTNAITATYPATDLTEAVALALDLRTLYEAHRVLTAGSVHGGADSTNTIVTAAPSTWDEMITLCNEFKNTTGFNDHIALTAGPVHGADGSADAITAADSGVQKTALELEVNEFKTDLNAHIAHLGVHPTAGVANSTTAATTEATSVAMINGLKATINSHGTSADDHLDADAVAVAGTATKYEDILPVVAEWKAAYEAHRVKAAVHSSADAGNAETALGTGGEVTVGLLKG